MEGRIFSKPRSVVVLEAWICPENFTASCLLDYTTSCVAKWHFGPSVAQEGNWWCAQTGKDLSIDIQMNKQRQASKIWTAKDVFETQGVFFRTNKISWKICIWLCIDRETINSYSFSYPRIGVDDSRKNCDSSVILNRFKNAKNNFFQC